MSTRSAALLIVLVLPSCGAFVPDTKNFSNSPQADPVGVQTLLQHAVCELKDAVTTVLLDDASLAVDRKIHGLPPNDRMSWLKNWAAQLTFTLTVDEKSSFNPGISFSKIYPNAVTSFANHPSVNTSQSSSIGLAAAYSTQATVEDSFSVFVPFNEFTDDAALQKALPAYEAAEKSSAAERKSDCFKAGTPFIQGDLRLVSWLRTYTAPSVVQGGIQGNYAAELDTEEKVSKKDVISRKITFVMIYGGNVNPVWKFVDVTGNSNSSPLLTGQRTNTQNIIVTLGPNKAGTLPTEALNTTLASQIGIEVANGIRNTQ